MPSVEFEKAVLEIEKINGKLTDNDKLKRKHIRLTYWEPANEKKKLYALYKIANNETPKKPGMMDFVGKAKYKEWESVKDKYTTPEEGEKAYVEAVEGFKTQYGFDASRTEMSDGTKISDEKLKRYAELTA